MAVNLTKGQKVSLSKEKAGLDNIMIGLGWDSKPKKDAKKSLLASIASTIFGIDCDSFVLLLENDRLKSRHDIVNFTNLRHNSNAVTHHGDNLTGDGDGDDEEITITLSRIPEKYNKLVFGVNIFGGRLLGQHFGMVANAFIRLVDKRDNQEILRFNLSENYDGMNVMVFAEVYRNSNGEWEFNPVGQGYKGGESTVSKQYGL